MNVRKLLVLLLLLPVATAQINGPQDFDASYGFTDIGSDDFMTIVSGAAVAEVTAAQETWGFIGVQGLEVTRVDEVCHRKLPGTCITGDLRLVADDGGGYAFKWPTATGTFRSDHTFGFLMTSSGSDLNSLILNETLVAPSIGGSMQFDARAPAPAFLGPAARMAAMAVVVPLFDDSRVHLEDADGRIATFSRADGLVYFAGIPSIEPFAASTAILPFSDEAAVTFTEADADAAREGISLQRITEVQNLLSQASEGSSETAEQQPQDNAVFESLSEILDAALIRVPLSGNQSAEEVVQEITIVFFEDLTVASQEGDLSWDGAAAFQYQGGEVVGAQSLFGFWFFQLPWWGWLLWVVALGLFVARLAVKPDPHHDRWDRFRWVGWVASIVMFVIVFFLWDIEMRSVWGTSVLSTGTSGTAFWITFGLQMLTMAIVLGAVAWPLGIIVKNSLLLARQGTFMGLGKPTSLLLSYLLGATLFLAYLELLLASVMDNLG